jgi:hypothetical protein
MSPENRFQHHGVAVETREQWAARQAAEAAIRARAEEDARRNAAAAAIAAKAAKVASAATAAKAASEARAATAAWAVKAANAAKAATAAKPVSVEPPDEVRPAATGAFKRTMLYTVAGLLAVTCAGMLLFRGAGTTPVPAEQEVVFEAVKVSPQPSRGPAILGVMPRLVGGGRPPGGSLADAPTIDPASGVWWCICYKSNGGADHTACRRQYSECESLREMVQTTGSGAIVQGSAHPGSCQGVRGSYPWEQLGHREAWRPSAYSDATGGATAQERDRRRATQAPGVCAL